MYNDSIRTKITTAKILRWFDRSRAAAAVILPRHTTTILRTRRSHHSFQSPVDGPKRIHPRLERRSRDSAVPRSTRSGEPATDPDRSSRRSTPLGEQVERRCAAPHPSTPGSDRGEHRPGKQYRRTLKAYRSGRRGSIRRKSPDGTRRRALAIRRSAKSIPVTR